MIYHDLYTAREGDKVIRRAFILALKPGPDNTVSSIVHVHVEAHLPRRHLKTGIYVLLHIYPDAI